MSAEGRACVLSAAAAASRLLPPSSFCSLPFFQATGRFLRDGKTSAQFRIIGPLSGARPQRCFSFRFRFVFRSAPPVLLHLSAQNEKRNEARNPAKQRLGRALLVFAPLGSALLMAPGARRRPPGAEELLQGHPLLAASMRRTSGRPPAPILAGPVLRPGSENAPTSNALENRPGLGVWRASAGPGGIKKRCRMKQLHIA